ncbi:helix-turn-helix transcriptional regulator [Pseudoflavonifractor capillosus]|uniref:Helix-turn-helix domain-containing protein n=1 Tax=Pseudoflavonifractor capillosus TaxID=106588 RepID=A0A921SRD6_9FIRM|nr:helix-turn-helix transcriptional regulator [Pseudoflavonifractor capillosus]HJG85745.1 helix-turn-helix domain-containing protein [Pseudoflavonifractor capillosus]
MSTPVERIFSLLKVKEIEQKEFAQLLGTTDKTVSAWKTGRSQSYTKYLPKISEVLGTTVEYLLTGEKTEPTVQDDGLTEGERALMKQFRQLTPEQQDMVLRMVQAAADNQQ